MVIDTFGIHINKLAAILQNIVHKLKPLIFLLFFISCSTSKLNTTKTIFCQINQTTFSQKLNKNYNCDLNYKNFKTIVKRFNLRESELKKIVFLIGCSDAGTIRMTNNFDALIYDVEKQKIYRYSTNNYDGKNNPKKDIINLKELKEVRKKNDELNFYIYNYIYDRKRFDKMILSLKDGSNISEVSCQRFFYFIDKEDIKNSYLKVFWNGFFRFDE